MPRLDFDQVPDPQDFTPIPEGRYLVRVDRIEEARTQYGDEMWNVTLKVEGHEKYTGRLVFDRLVFSKDALPRVKLVCSRLGLATCGQVDLQPDNLVGNRAHIDVVVEEYTDREGRVKKRNSIPFAGYHRAEGVAPADPHPAAAAFAEDRLPF